MTTSTLPIQYDRVEKTKGDAYLRFQIDEDTLAALSMQHTQEVIVVASNRITSMPNMPSWILGLINHRSHVMWAINLAEMLGLRPLNTNTEYYNVVIIRVGESPLAVIVKEVKGVVRLHSNVIQSTLESLTPSLVPYLQGCTLKQSELLLVLDAEAIVNNS